MTLAVVVACASGWLTILCLSVYTHRAMAHRALALHPAVAHFMRFWLWLTTGASTRAWVAVHRKHHAFVDREGDPHSPVVYGLGRIFFLGYWYYRRAARDPEVLERYGKGCPEDWLERNLYVRFDLLGLGLLLTAEMLILGVVPGLVAFAIQAAWEELWAAGVINGLGHAVGYRNHQVQDASTNIVPWGVLVSGEELHNNHHRYPRSARFSTRWWEVDIGWLFIRGLAAVGLARDLYVFDRRIELHRLERVERRMQVWFQRWREHLAALEANSKLGLAQKREEVVRFWSRLSRRVERRAARFDRRSRERLEALRDRLLQTLQAAFPHLVTGDAAV